MYLVGVPECQGQKGVTGGQTRSSDSKREREKKSNKEEKRLQKQGLPGCYAARRSDGNI